MPDKVGAAQGVSYGDVEEFVGSEKDTLEGFYKVKTAVGDLCCAFYTIAECARYLSIDSKHLLESIEKDPNYKLSDHIKKLKEAFNYYQQKPFYRAPPSTEEEVKEKSGYEDEFSQKNKLTIYNADNIIGDFDGVDTTKDDWFDQLRKHDNKQLYHFIVGSYLATIYKKVKLEHQHEGDGGEEVNNLLPEQLIAYAELLFPNYNIVSRHYKYFCNNELMNIIHDYDFISEAKLHLEYDKEKQLFFMPLNKDDFAKQISGLINSIELDIAHIQQNNQDEMKEYLDNKIKGLELLKIYLDKNKFTERETLYYYLDREERHFSALIPIDRFEEFNKAIVGLQIDGEEVQDEKFPSPNPTLQNAEDKSKKEAERINNELLKKLKESKVNSDSDENKAQEEFNSPSKYSGLGLKVELVGDPPSENHQGEFEYKYKIIGCIENGLASGFYNMHWHKDLQIVFTCNPEDHDQFITNIRNLERVKEDGQSLFKILSGNNQIIAGGNKEFESNNPGLNILYGPIEQVAKGIIERKFYRKNGGQDNYISQSYDEYKKNEDRSLVATPARAAIGAGLGDGRQ